MTFQIDTVLRDQLQVIEEVDVETAQEFCQFALQILEKEPQPKVLEKAAKRLDWPVEKLQTVLEAITELLKRTVKEKSRQVDKEELLASLRNSGLSPAIADVLAEFCFSSQDIFHEYLQNTSCKTPRLKKFEWRLEVETASRSIQNSIRPLLLVQLKLEDSRRSESVHTLQLDIPTLRHVTDELEQALREMKSTHARKVMRNIK